MINLFCNSYTVLNGVFREELDIDLKAIGKKMKAVILPCIRSSLDPASIRENPDFWGPLTVVMLFSLVSLVGQLRVVTWILTIWLAGSFIIYFITRSLGGEVEYAQCLGIIGYCLLPLFLMCTIGTLCNLGGLHNFGVFVAVCSLFCWIPFIFSISPMRIVASQM